MKVLPSYQMTVWCGFGARLVRTGESAGRSSQDERFGAEVSRSLPPLGSMSCPFGCALPGGHPEVRGCPPEEGGVLLMHTAEGPVAFPSWLQSTGTAVYVVVGTGHGSGSPRCA